MRRLWRITGGVRPVRPQFPGVPGRGSPGPAAGPRLLRKHPILCAGQAVDGQGQGNGRGRRWAVLPIGPPGPRQHPSVHRTSGDPSVHRVATMTGRDPAGSDLASQDAPGGRWTVVRATGCTRRPCRASAPVAVVTGRTRLGSCCDPRSSLVSRPGTAIREERTPRGARRRSPARPRRWDACRLPSHVARRACMTMHRRCIVMRVMHNTAGRPAPASTTTLGEPPVSGHARP
jgi:hypothetical protein